MIFPAHFWLLFVSDCKSRDRLCARVHVFTCGFRSVPLSVVNNIEMFERRDDRVLLFITNEPLVRTQTLSLLRPVVGNSLFIYLWFYWCHMRSPLSRWYRSCGWVAVISTASRLVSLNPLSTWLTYTALIFLLTLLVLGVHVVTRRHTHTRTLKSLFWTSELIFSLLLLLHVTIHHNTFDILTRTQKRTRFL